MDILTSTALEKDWKIYYSESLGDENQWITSKKETLPQKVPYFSLLIIKK